jgi:hypothetical protein
MIDTTFRQLEWQTGWDDSSKVCILSEFIRKQGLQEQAIAYINAQADEEEAMCLDDPENDPDYPYDDEEDELAE